MRVSGQVHKIFELKVGERVNLPQLDKLGLLILLGVPESVSFSVSVFFVGFIISYYFSHVLLHYTSGWHCVKSSFLLKWHLEL